MEQSTAAARKSARTRSQQHEHARDEEVQNQIALHYFSIWHRDMDPVLDRLYALVDDHPDIFVLPTSTSPESRLHRLAMVLEVLLAEKTRRDIIEDLTRTAWHGGTAALQGGAHGDA